MSRETSHYYELAQPFATNPDPQMAGCLNSGREEPGVVFPGIEVLEAAYCFVGATSLYEAVAAINGISVKAAKSAIEDAGTEREEVKRLRAEVEALHDQLAAYEAFASAAEEAGLIIKSFD